MCPGDGFKVTCSVRSALVIRWGLNIPGHEPFKPVQFIITSPENYKAIGPFSLVLVSKDPLISAANLSSVGNDQNGTVLSCSNTFRNPPFPNETSDIVIHLEGRLNFALYM